MDADVESLAVILGISSEEADTILDACGRDIERSVEYFFAQESRSLQHQQPKYDGPTITALCKIAGQGNDLSLSSIHLDGKQFGSNGWKGFRIIVFDPSDWSIMSDKAYCAYTPNKVPDMKIDVASLPLGVLVLVATTDATCNADGTNRMDVLVVMRSLGSTSFEEAYKVNPMRTAYCGLLRKGGSPIKEDAIPEYGTTLTFKLEGKAGWQSTQSYSLDTPRESSKDRKTLSYDSIIRIPHHPHDLKPVPAERRRTASCDLCGSNGECTYYCSSCNWDTCQRCTELPHVDVNLTLVQAIKSRKSKAVINAIIQRNPDCLRLREQSQLPLHWALFMGNFELFFMLLDAYPDACKEKFADGWLCLHTAVSAETPQALFDRLLAVYPNGARVKNMDGLIPIQLAVVKKNFKDHYFASLIAADLPFNPTDTSRVSEHAYSWTWVVDANNNVPVETCSNLVHAIFARFPQLIHLLAYAEDQSGRQAIMIAHKDVRAVIASYVHFMGQYEVKLGAPLHKSATALVVCAVDHQSTTEFSNPLNMFDFANGSLVALKFMKHRDQFMREIISRKEYNLSDDYVLGIDRSFDSANNERFQREIARNSEWSEYRFCIVMKAADRNLKHIIDSEHICGCDWDSVKSIAQQLAKALEHVHSCNIIHGDIKPLNIVRVGAKIKLIDLDASIRYSPRLQFAGVKWSSAYLAPEMIHVDPVSGEGSIKSSFGIRRGQEHEGRAQLEAEQGRLPYDMPFADPSQDMWAFGCVLFNLCAGETLWPSNYEDNISDNDVLVQLAQWGQSKIRLKKLAKIADPVARHLVSLLLSAEPSLRPPSMLHVRRHPFFTGQLMSRTPEDRATFDIFISYRVDSDVATAELLFNMLTARGLNVWWDKKRLIAGKNWEDGFCNGLVNSDCFVPLLSRAGMQSRFQSLTESSPCDNVLLEFRMALELEKRGLIQSIYPLFIGDHIIDATGDSSFGHYFAHGCQPAATDTVVTAVEDKLAEHLDKQGLGLPLNDQMGIKTILTTIFAHQGGFLTGKGGMEALLAEHVSALTVSNSTRRGESMQDGADVLAGVAGVTIADGAVDGVGSAREYATVIAAKEAALREALSENKRLRRLLESQHIAAGTPQLANREAISLHAL